MSEKPLGKLEHGLITALKALDNQIARELQRTPEERSQHGVQKWEPISTRVENLTSLLLNACGDGELQLDGLFVLSQSLVKTLAFISEDLGVEGLGNVRTAYMQSTFENILNDIRKGKASVEGEVVAN